jgi:hypothetical protein
MEFKEVVPEQSIDVDSFSILPVLVDHIVPTIAYVVTDGASSVVFGADSGPTDRLWQRRRSAETVLRVRRDRLPGLNGEPGAHFEASDTRAAIGRSEQNGWDTPTYHSSPEAAISRRDCQ